MKIGKYILLAVGQIIIIIMSALAGYYCNKWIDGFNELAVIPFVIALISASSIAFVSAVFGYVTKSTSDYIGKVTNDVKSIKRLVTNLTGERANIYQLDEAYERMAYAVNEAEHSVTLLTRHRYNKCTGAVNIPEQEQSISNKADYYEAMLNAIQNQSVDFRRLIQVDEDLLDNWHEPIANSEYLSREIVNVCLGQNGKAPRARIYVTAPRLDMSLILIDNKKLFFNLFSVVDGEYSSPYMFYIESEFGNLPHIHEIFEQYTDGVPSIGCKDAHKINDLLKFKNRNNENCKKVI